MQPLCLSSGTRSKQEGTDLATVAKELPDAHLRWWILAWECDRVLYHELRILQAEADRRRLATSRRDLVGQRTLF